MKNILFYCLGNSCRSQMAEGFAKIYSKGNFKVFSAGSQPLGYVSPEAIEVMQEKEIDISKQYSKGFKDLPKTNFDIVVSMGCKDNCPFVPAEKHIYLTIEDPYGQGIEKFKEVRDVIEEEVRKIINYKLGITNEM